MACWIPGHLEVVLQRQAVGHLHEDQQVHQDEAQQKGTVPFLHVGIGSGTEMRPAGR